MKKRGSKLGQAAIEYLIIVGFAMAIILPLTYLIYNYSEESYGEVASAQIMTLGRQIVSNAETVYYLGAPSRITLDMTMPNGVRNMTIYKNMAGGCTKCYELRFSVQNAAMVEVLPFSSAVNLTAANDLLVNTADTGSVIVQEFDRRIYSQGLKHITVTAKEDSVEIGLR